MPESQYTDRLHALGLELPPPPKPGGNYLPWVICGPWLYLSAQFPIENGEFRYTGRVGAELTEEQGYAAARLAALNVLAQVQAALGGFASVECLARVEGHIACVPGAVNPPRVLDGASDLFLAVLGERGRHTRALSTPECLPFNLAVELVVTVRIRGRRGAEQEQENE